MGKGGDADHLIQAAANLRELENSYLGSEQQADKIAVHGKGTNWAGKKLQQDMNLVEEEAGNGEREVEGKIWKLESLEQKQKASGLSFQIESEAEDGNNGLKDEKLRPKRRKWKYHARNYEGKWGTKDGQTKGKRSRMKRWKQLHVVSMNYRRWLKTSPADSHEDLKLERSGIGERPDVPRSSGVSREGMGGGLAMLWNSEITVEIKSFSCHHIDAVVYSEKGSYWRCTVLNLNEKLGGNEKQVNSVADFREAVRECDFIDMGFTGYPFTWSNRRFGVGLIEERLDRFLCSRSWGHYFQEKAAMNLVTWSSDHNPILMEVLEKGSGLRYSRRTFRRVHYEDMWSPYEKCREIVKREWKESSCWDRGNPVDLFQRKSKESLAELKLWSNEEFKGRQKRLKQLKERLKEIRQNYGHYDSGLEVKNIERQIDNILIDEEIFWKQRSRADWLREGDRNTKFFHAKASARKRKNKIMGLEDEDGLWKEEAEEVERLLCDYFANIFSTTNPSQTQLETAVAELPKRVTEETNCFLDQQFTAEEVAEALAQMCPTKAPGPDGLPAAFYHKHWSSVKEGVTTTCLHILNEGDDSLVFSRASSVDCRHLKKIFEMYAAASGQIFNFEKSSIFFSTNTKQSQMDEIGSIFNLNVVSRHERQIIHKGSRWRIGNGEQVYVYKSNWIPRPENLKPLSIQTLHPNSVVANLISNQTWKEDVISHNFSEEDVARIKRIILPSSPQLDQLIWHFDKHGNYSVKSGYQLSLILKSPDLASSSDLSKTHWKIIWSMEIPEKIKIFMWRAAQNMLPTAYNLWKRKAIKEPMCGKCSKEKEDGFHSLIGCKYANKVWKLTDFHQNMKMLAQQDLLSTLQEMGKIASMKDMELIIATCWSIWSSRNLFIFKGKEEDAQISVGRAAAVVESYRRIKIPATQIVSQNQSNNQQTWLPPPNGWYKVNVDAAIRPSNQTASLGVVIRDSRAKVVAAAVQNTIYKGDVDCMEAEAINFGIQVAQNTNFLPMIIESDSKEVVDLACNRKGSRTEIFWKIATIQDSLKRLGRVQIQHVSRSFNRIAHGLAKKALEYVSSAVWLGNYPDEILLLLAIDS
ncbi:putative reverse transcriptase/RNA-dependent DNA polymerase [Citrus sinensis]|uniref:Reverse transcriptase/RNA-dependent DNA polymerase n=1 Tax=Citrus sinensis TaxID=2711 RepID=A0ACB8JG78_CITSI|nr:putative reverse transcriptase/RNA-dependent DNA polymerase [Citrus sinensis]